MKKSASKTLGNALESASLERQQETARISAELDFAGKLCEFHKDMSLQWRNLISKAEKMVESAAGGSISELKAAVRDAEKILAPVAETAKSYNIHCVGHAHIDMNWMWSWPETVAVTNDTFSTMIRLMEEYPQFHFSQSQASVYRIVEEHNPALLEKIRRRVKEGRWEVTASHWVEGDKNMAGPESLCRHILCTRAYLRALLGLKPEDVVIDWSPDTFGHPVTVPSYLVRGGVKYLYLHRPGVFTKEKPEVFWWRSPDGSKVLVRNDMRLGYNGSVGTGTVTNDLVNFVRNTGGLREWMFVYGVGDHGGGPTRRDISRIIEMNSWPIFPTIKFSRAQTFYSLLEKDGGALPVIDTELNVEFTGCYTTQTLIKKANRFSENRLVDAEFAAGMDWAVAGKTYPTEQLQISWRDTLFSHFHDILPGSGVHDTRAYTSGLYQKTMAAASMIETQALRHIASLIDTTDPEGVDRVKLPALYTAGGIGAGVGNDSSDGRISKAEQSAGDGTFPFVFFNPTAWERNEIVEVKIWDNGSHKPFNRSRTFSVRTPQGKTIPTQFIAEGGYWGHNYLSLAFPVKVPAYGYAAYTVVEESSEPARGELGFITYKHHCFYGAEERRPEGIENKFVRLEIDPKTGGISRLLDKRSGLELVSPSNPAPAFEFGMERPIGMSAWCVGHDAVIEPPRLKSVTKKFQDWWSSSTKPYKLGCELQFVFRESKATILYELHDDDPSVYVKFNCEWFQRGTKDDGIPFARMAIPVNLEKPEATYEIPFGSIRRPSENGMEYPALQWVKVDGVKAGKKAGLLLGNDSKYGHSILGSTLRMTLIRAAYEPDPLPEIGNHEVNMVILPYAGEMPGSEAAMNARMLNHPLKAVSTDAHKGGLPKTESFLDVSPANVIVSSIKKAEGARGIVVRLYEADGKDTRAEIALNTKLLGDVKSAEETDLLERPAKNGSVKFAKGKLSVGVPAYGITTVLIRQ